MSLLSLKQVRCSMTKHLPPVDAEKKLFSGETLTVETECQRCHSPLILERDLDNNDHFYMSEHIEAD